MAAASGLMNNLVVHSLALSGTNLYAGTGGSGIFLSTNNGTSWMAINYGLSGYGVLSLLVSGTNLFAGTDYGVFLSTNNGSRWMEVDSGLMNYIVVHSLAVSGTNLFAGTGGSGVWRRPLSEMATSVERVSTDIPTLFSLSQNYPNPFNPATTISFSLPSRSFVTLKVFDILGKEVSTLVSQELPSGAYSRQWNATNISTGVYFYRLQAGTYSETKKLLLLR